MTSATRPRTRYAKSGDVNIAYQVIGQGKLDLVYVPGWVSNVELNWDEPSYARFPMCALFAATHPDRTSALIVYGSHARRLKTDDYPWGRTEEERMAFLREIEDGWGGPVGLKERAPGAIDDERFVDWWSAYLRHSASPRACRTLSEMNYEAWLQAPA